VRKFALIFVLAVLLPSIVLGWLAFDSLRNQEFVFERQQELLLQGASDTLAERVRKFLGEKLNEFGDQVDQMASRADVVVFNKRIRAKWPAAAVGFAVTLDGKLIAPSPKEDESAKRFLEANSRFLTNTESAEVYQQPVQPALQSIGSRAEPESQQPQKSEATKPQREKERRKDEAIVSEYAQQNAKSLESADAISKLGAAATPPVPVFGSPRMIARSVSPQKELKQNDTSISKVLPAEAEFRQLIGTAMSGSDALFVGNELFVIFWHRTTAEPDLVLGAEVNLNEFTKDFEHLILPDYDLAKTVCVALLDDKGKPVVTTAANFATNWKRPFVATEVGELLPQWEIGVYLLNPAFANQIAISLQRSVGTTIGLLLCAIGIGGWLIWRDLGRQVRLARQKTDFVSNVSHELKTPLTSIRMFSELLANNPDPDRQKRYSEIIVNESSRLTRLINNVLDFARMERRSPEHLLSEIRFLNSGRSPGKTIVLLSMQRCTCNLIGFARGREGAGLEDLFEATADFARAICPDPRTAICRGFVIEPSTELDHVLWIQVTNLTLYLFQSHRDFFGMRSPSGFAIQQSSGLAC
jgi:hypothetical protein